MCYSHYRFEVFAKYNCSIMFVGQYLQGAARIFVLLQKNVLGLNISVLRNIFYSNKIY